VELRIASTNRFCPIVLGATDVPRAVRSVSPRTSLGLSPEAPSSPSSSPPLISSIVCPTEESDSWCPFSRRLLEQTGELLRLV
jgi:hypothetical protein